MSRSRATGLSQDEILELARVAKSKGLNQPQFFETVRVAGGYAGIPSVQQAVHKIRHYAEIIVEDGGPDHPAYGLATEALELLAFERASRAGGLFSKFIARDGTLRPKNATVAGLNLADESAE